MKGDIAFVGFMLTADEWQELDAQSRAQLIAVATRRTDAGPTADDTARPRRFPDGTGKHEIIESLDDELDQLLLRDAELVEPIKEPDAAVAAALDADIARIDRDGDLPLFTEDTVVFDTTAQYDVIEEWLALQPQDEHIDMDEWVALPPALAYVPPTAAPQYEDFADWAEL